MFKRLCTFLKSWQQFLVTFAVLVTIQNGLVSINPVPSASMRPVIQDPALLFTNNLAYGVRVPFTSTWLKTFEAPRVGEVVTFNSPLSGELFVKRVAALPGDTVDGRVLNGYWMLGDNVDHSADSRIFGEVPLSTIHGKVLAVLDSNGIHSPKKQ